MFRCRALSAGVLFLSYTALLAVIVLDFRSSATAFFPAHPATREVQLTAVTASPSQLVSG